jgi:hypothetical protein
MWVGLKIEPLLATAVPVGKNLFLASQGIEVT